MSALDYGSSIGRELAESRWRKPPFHFRGGAEEDYVNMCVKSIYWKIAD